MLQIYSDFYQNILIKFIKTKGSKSLLQVAKT